MSETPLEIALQRIEECRRTRSTELDLSELGLEEIPEEVFELTWLETLDVSDSDWEDRRKIEEIPSAIRKLIVLKYFNCRFEQISDISPLCGLPALSSIDCRNNQLKDLKLRDLPSLLLLDCRFNHLRDLELSNLPVLSSLDCRDNKLKTLKLNYLPSLSLLDCRDNLLRGLQLNDLPMLSLLDCRYNQLRDLKLNNLDLLSSIDCCFNQLSSLRLSL